MSKQGYIFVSIAFLIIALAGYGVYSLIKGPKVDIRALPVFNEVQQIKEVVKIKRVKVPVKEIVTIEKTKVVKDLQLPEWVKKDDNQQIIATGIVEPNRNKGNVEAVTTLNTQTGESAILMRQKERPLFGFPNEKEIGIGYGIDTKGRAGITGYGRWDVLRIGNIVIHAYGEANSHSEAKIELRAGYRF